MMTTEAAIRLLRQEPQWQPLIHDAYLGPDLDEAAHRFGGSAEFHSAIQLLGGSVRGREILDLGAGSGIASIAFAKNGARHVYAVEPDSSAEIGRGALCGLADGLPITVLDAFGEALPLDDKSVDVVYTRQVLHHTQDLCRVLGECARVLRPGGLFLACREHVVSDDRQLQEFLRSHPVHALTGGENAFTLPEYVKAIDRSGLELVRVIGPWDSVINAFPLVRSDNDLVPYLRGLLLCRLGIFGNWCVRLPGVVACFRWFLNRRGAGRLYSFFARKSLNLDH